MPRLDRALAHLPELFESRDGVEQRRLDPGNGGSDPGLDRLRVANVSRAIVGGDLTGAWELGVAAIREVLRAGR